ncbi:MAG: dehydrogenase [Bacteroidetes bacterium]|jgi:NAD(P)H-hydrate epimerase|nr:dehydrogenase [Bacteroidota bacterium]
MKILSAEQIKAVDEYTIANEPVSSAELMERAAMFCTRRLMRLITDESRVIVVCGKGNNGGDGLVIARLLMDRGFDTTVFIIEHRNDFSADAQINYDSFKSKSPEKIFHISTIDEFKVHFKGDDAIVIDAIFGNGLNKPVSGIAAEVIQSMNESFRKIISVDVPSGLFIDNSSIENEAVIRSLVTFTFQFPKLAFLFPENKHYVPEFEIVDIGLHQGGISLQPTNYYYLTKEDLLPLLRKRMKFDHKGTYGHSLLVAGSQGKSGAAIISAKACMRSGAGLLTVHSNKETLNALLNHLPEAMGSEDRDAEKITEIDPERYTAIAFGPGIGTHEDTQTVLKKLLNYYKGKLVIDADGLNILSENKTWLNFLPPGTILTPHPKEFERLVGESENEFERLKILKQFSLKYNCIVVLKGAHSAVAMPDGNVFFNSSGNPSLAKAGSGDGLTGIILGLLSRGYNAPQAAIIGTYIHGYAADLCLKKMSMESVLISDVINQLPKAFRKLEEMK